MSMAPALKRRRLLAHDDNPSLAQWSHERSGASRMSQDKGQPLPRQLQITTQTPQMLQLKVDELLANTTRSHENRSEAESAASMLKDLIWKIPDIQPQSVTECEKSQETLDAPIPFNLSLPAESLNYQLAYAKPDNIKIIGRDLNTAYLKGNEMTSIEVVVEMPDDLFQVKDFLNYRYFHKRAFYLACLVSGIRAKLPSNVTLRYRYHNDIPLDPYLVAEVDIANSGTSPAPQVCVSIYPQITNHKLFLTAKTMPGRMCLASTVIASLDQSHESCSNFYNSCLRASCVRSSYQNLIDSLMAESKAYRASCALGEIWLRQREFNSSISGGGFGAFEWNLVAAFLLIQSQQDVRIGFAQRYTSLQMFKAVLQFLSSKNLLRTRHIVRFGHPPIRPDLDSLTGPVFFDAEEGLNILYKMSESSYGVLRDVASCNLSLLGDPFADQFQTHFIRKSSFQVYRYDMMIQLPLRGVFMKIGVEPGNPGLPFHTRDRLYELLRRGLGDRVSLIGITVEESKPWEVNLKGSVDLKDRNISVYLRFNSQCVDRAIDKGPSIEASKAEADGFRSLWGEKAELRRFHDGSILEAVVWPTSPEGSSVVSRVVKHLLNMHIVPDNVDAFKIFESREEVILPNDTMSLNQVSSYQSSSTSFERLERTIRDIKELPLQIHQISPADPILYHMSFRGSYRKSKADNFVGPINVIVRFEASTRWPNNLAAIQRSKIAFLLKIGELLENGDGGSFTQLSLGSQWGSSKYDAFLDYHGSDGNAFRLRLHVDSEERLMREELQLTSKSSKEREAAAQALSDYKRDHIQRPRHAQAMKAAMTRFKAFAPSVRILKKWRDCHLLSNHLSDELLELFAIRSFVHPGEYSIPGSALTAFYLTLLFISRWDWRSQPYIVDISGELSRDDFVNITTRFEAWRRIDPAMNKVVIFAASNLDPEGVTWTGPSPSIVAAARFTSLAKAATACVQAEGHRLPPAALFQAGLEDYDFVIYPQPHLAKQVQHENVQPHDLIALLLNELAQLYSDCITFFYSQSDMKFVGGLWKPDTKSRSWKSQQSSSAYFPQEGGQHLSPVKHHQATIINEIARIGCEMIKEIKLKE